MTESFYRLSILTLLWMLTINEWDDWSLFTQGMAFVALIVGATVVGWMAAREKDNG